MPYKHTSKRADEIARELGVECLLEGSVRGENGSVRMRAQLIRAGNKTQLWARCFDRKLDDFLVVQCDVATHIVRALAAQFLPS